MIKRLIPCCKYIFQLLPICNQMSVTARQNPVIDLNINKVYYIYFSIQKYTTIGTNASTDVGI